MEEFGVELEVLSSTAQRVEFTADVGNYEFFCNVPGHEDMKGTLVASGDGNT